MQFPSYDQGLSGSQKSDPTPLKRKLDDPDDLPTKRQKIEGAYLKTKKRKLDEPDDLPTKRQKIKHNYSKQPLPKDAYETKLNKVYNKGCHIENKHVKEFAAKIQESLPPLYNILTDESWKSDWDQTIEIVQESPDSALPTIKGLNLVADRYKEKYGIDIKVIGPETKQRDGISASDLQSALEEELKNTTSRCVGIIYDVKGSTDHVIPLLFSMDNGVAKVLILDVLGNRTDDIYTFDVLNDLDLLKIPYSESSAVRQSDIYSCRIGSLVTLRNALLTIQEGRESAFKPFETCKIEGNTNKATFDFPPEWGGAHDQIFRPNEPVDHVLNPRQKYSKSPDKQEKIETILTTRERYLIEFPFKITYTLPPCQLTQDLNIETLNLPKEIKVSRSDSGELTTSWTTMKKVNGYMLMKGRKEAGL